LTKYTLPITCKQGAIILLCAMFIGGIYMMWDTYHRDTIWIYSIGMFVMGFPTVVGICCGLWYSYAFIDKHVQCRCDK